MQESSAVWKVLLLLALMLLFTLLAMGVWALCFGGNQSVNSLKVMQMLQTVGTFLFPCLAGAYIWSEEPWTWLSMDKKVGWKEGLAVFVLILVASPAVNLLASWNEKMVLPDFLSGLEELMKSQEEAAAALTEQFIRADNVWVLLYNLLLMALLPALSEETLFRGTLQQMMYKGTSSISTSNNSPNTKQHVAVWVSAILFSAIHFQFYGFVPRMLLGVLFGYLLLWSGSLWLPILAHFTNNAMAVILYNIYYMQGKNVDEIDALGTGDTLWLGILSIILTALGVYLIRKLLRLKQEGEIHKLLDEGGIDSAE